MKRIPGIALSAVLVVAPLASVQAAGHAGALGAGRHILQWFGKIGVAWEVDKPAWMGFVAFSPDGKQVASDGPASSHDVSGDLTLWSFPQGKLIRRLPGRPVSISGNWKYYADPSHVRRVETGEPAISLPENAFATYAFSHDSSRVAISKMDKSVAASIAIRSLENGKETIRFGRHTVFSMAFSPNDEYLASGGWDTVTFWNPRTGAWLGTVHGAGRYVEAVSFSNDGKLLAAGTDAGGLQIVDVGSRKTRHFVQLEGGYVSQPAFSSDGKLLAVGTYGTGTLWLVDVQTGSVLDSRKISDLGCGSVAFSPDGRYLIAPSTGGLVVWPWDIGGTVRVFRVRDAK